MNAWWQFIHILGTAKKLSISSGCTMEVCVKAMHDLFVACEYQGYIKLGPAGFENIDP